MQGALKHAQFIDKSLEITLVGGISERKPVLRREIGMIIGIGPDQHAIEIEFLANAGLGHKHPVVPCIIVHFRG